MFTTHDEFNSVKWALENGAQFNGMPAPSIQNVYDAMHSCYAFRRTMHTVYSYCDNEFNYRNPLTGEVGIVESEPFWLEWNGKEYVTIYR